MTTTPSKELQSQVAIVTGSSSGIGRAIALELAAAGAAVVVHGRQRREAAQQVADEIRSGGSEADVVMADLSGEPGRDTLVEQAWQRFQRVDILVNNAGADILTGAAAHWPFQRKSNALWDLDVTATIQLSREIGSRMRARGSGVILNLGWDGADRGMPGDSAQLFAAAKGAVMAFSRSLAQSLAPAVRVNCLAPGWIQTAWGLRASEFWQQRAKQESLLGRWGTPEDVARAARFLVSPAAGFINGQTIVVNGGYGQNSEFGIRNSEGGRPEAE
jgi:3-oxoacyl-[acyl-carrier protein] reductase